MSSMHLIRSPLHASMPALRVDRYPDIGNAHVFAFERELRRRAYDRLNAEFAVRTARGELTAWLAGQC